MHQTDSQDPENEMQALPCVLSEGEHLASIADSSLGFKVKQSKSLMSVFHEEPPFPRDIWPLTTLYVGMCLSLVRSHSWWCAISNLT